MADNQEIDNDISNSTKNNYKDKSDENKAGLGGKLNMVKDEEVEAEFSELEDQNDFSVAVDLTESLKKWPVKRSRSWVEVEPATSTSEDHRIRDSCDPVALAREYLKKYGLKHTENIDKSEPASSIPKAKTLDTNPFDKSGYRKTDGFSVESRSNGVVPRESASKLASESDGKSNFDEEEVLQIGSSVTPKHSEPVPKSGSKPQPKDYRCSICGMSFPTFQAMGGHKGRHRSIPLLLALPYQRN